MAEWRPAGGARVRRGVLTFREQWSLGLDCSANGSIPDCTAMNSGKPDARLLTLGAPLQGLPVTVSEARAGRPTVERIKGGLQSCLGMAWNFNRSRTARLMSAANRERGGPFYNAQYYQQSEPARFPEVYQRRGRGDIASWAWNCARTSHRTHAERLQVLSHSHR
jgi:hypothetical protein